MELQQYSLARLRDRYVALAIIAITFIALSVVSDIDRSTALWLNKAVNIAPLNRIINLLCNDALFRGGPIFAAIIAFAERDKKSRDRMAVSLILILIAVGISVLSQRYLFVHLRPLLDTRLNLNYLVEQWKSPEQWGKRISSFPSDTATLFFGLSALIYLENKKFGQMALLWTAVTTGIGRVILGWHYPSDILGGCILGWGIVIFGHDWLMRRPKVQKFFASTPSMVIAICFYLLLLEAYGLFHGFQEILASMNHVSSP